MQKKVAGLSEEAVKTVLAGLSGKVRKSQ